MSALTLTQHAILRMSQRGIRPNDLELIESIGTEVEGARELKTLRDQVRRLVGKRVVRAGDAVVTTYHASRTDERRLLRGGYNGD